MATANFNIQPEDGWVEVTSAGVDFIKIKQYPDSQPIYITTGSSTPSSSSSFAAGTITFSGQPIADETVTVGADTFVFKASAAGALEVTIGASAQATLDNLLAKITAETPNVVASKRSATIIDVRAASTGTAGNSIVLTEAATNIAVSGAGTLTGGTTEVIGFRLNCQEFWCDVPETDKFYVRCVTPKPDIDLRVDVFYILS